MFDRIAIGKALIPFTEALSERYLELMYMPYHQATVADKSELSAIDYMFRLIKAAEEEGDDE